MAELQDIIDFKMGDIRKIARLKLGNIAHLKKQFTSVYFNSSSADLDAIELTQLLV